METVTRDADRPGPLDGTGLAAASGALAGGILPVDPAERRRRERLYALRAMDRLGLLGEGELIPTLTGRPELRWLADEGGARVGILVELGRIRDPAVFEAAVGWVLRNRPRTDEARAEIRRIRTGGLAAGNTEPFLPA